MNNIQRLINEKMESGKSYRRIGEECKISHVSIARYHQGESTPNGKNLAILGKYFNAKIEDLVEPVTLPGHAAQDVKEYGDEDSRLAPLKRLILTELDPLTESEQAEVLRTILEMKEVRKRSLV